MSTSPSKARGAHRGARYIGGFCRSLRSRTEGIGTELLASRENRSGAARFQPLRCRWAVRSRPQARSLRTSAENAPNLGLGGGAQSIRTLRRLQKPSKAARFGLLLRRIRACARDLRSRMDPENVSGGANRRNRAIPLPGQFFQVHRQGTAASGRFTGKAACRSADDLHLRRGERSHRPGRRTIWPRQSNVC